MMRLLWPFVMGSVALGLDAYVIAGLLPAIAASMESEEATVGLRSRSVHRLLRRLQAAGSGASWKMLTPQFDHRAGFVHDRECRDLPGLECGDVPRCAVGRGGGRRRVLTIVVRCGCSAGADPAARSGSFAGRLWSGGRYGVRCAVGVGRCSVMEVAGCDCVGRRYWCCIPGGSLTAGWGVA